MPMRIFKWSESFHVDRESPLVPVWVEFPRLPVHYFENHTLLAIASLLGTPLRLDASTASLKRPSVARVQVEIDLLKPGLEKLWIGVEGGEGFWQKVEYEDVPKYCQHCWHVGHSGNFCTVHNPELLTRTEKVQAPKEKQIYVPKHSSESGPSNLRQALVPPPAVRVGVIPAVTDAVQESVVAKDGPQPMVVVEEEPQIEVAVVETAGTQPAVVVEKEPQLEVAVVETAREQPVKEVAADTERVELEASEDDNEDKEGDGLSPLAPASLEKMEETMTLNSAAGLLYFRRISSETKARTAAFDHPPREELFQSLREFNMLLHGTRTESDSGIVQTEEQLAKAPRRRGRPQKTYLQFSRQAEQHSMVTRSSAKPLSQ